MSLDQPGFENMPADKSVSTQEASPATLSEDSPPAMEANQPSDGSPRSENAESDERPDTNSQPESPPSRATDDVAQPSPEVQAQPESPSSAPSPAPANPPQRRVELKPTVDPTQAKAIGTYSPTVSEPRPEASGPPEESDERPQPVSEEAIAAPANPVELPKAESLDPELEAEIAAAMSGEQEQALSQPQVDLEATDEMDEVASEETLTKGVRLKGTVQSIDGEDLFVDLGFRAPGVVKVRDFGGVKVPEVGQKIDVVVDRYDEPQGLILAHLPRASQRVAGNWQELSIGQTVECLVTKKNKGGLEVTVSNLRGFLPASQADVSFVADLEAFVGQKFQVRVIEVNPQKRNLVVSRRVILEEERREVGERIWQTLEAGQTYPGTVKTIKDYGAFIDIGGVDGFLHIGEISWNRLNHPSEALAVGQTVEVKVLTVDPDTKRIGLGMRQLVQNPWSTVPERYEVGTVVSGQVTKATKFGAFVMLEPGIEGLIHISELGHQRVNRVTDVVKIGQNVETKVLEVDIERKRIGLSLKALQERQAADLPDESPDEPPPVRKRKGPLKGGIGSQEGGGLFGNPRDFT